MFKSRNENKREKAKGGSCDPIELVAIDVDGTLLRGDKSVSPRCVTAIRNALKQGVHIVLASARPPRSTRTIYSHLNLSAWQINYNGALILDQPANRVVHHLPMASALVHEVIRYARDIEPRVVVSVEVLDRWLTDHVDPTLPTETAKSFQPDLVGPLERIIDSPVTKLLLLDKPERLNTVKKAVAKKFRGRISIAVSDPHLIQINHPEVDKGTALEMIAAHYGVAPQRVMAVGDAPNDLGMLNFAGFAVAMENAWPEVIRAADAIVPSNNDDGVAVAIERFVQMP